MDVQFWFFIHRPLMTLVTLITVVSFIIIFWALNASWVDSSNQLNYAHSVIGIIAIVFSVVQVSKLFLIIYF